MLSISEVISKLIQFDQTERQVNVVIYTRDSNGDVLSKQVLPVEACFSHNEHSAELVVNIKMVDKE